MHDIDNDKIRNRAYQLWEAAGQPEGREQDFWYQAERELAEKEDVDTSEETSTVTPPPVVPGGLG